MSHTMSPLDEKIASLCWGAEGRGLPLDIAAARLADWTAERDVATSLDIDGARAALQDEVQTRRLHPTLSAAVGDLIFNLDQLDALPSFSVVQTEDDNVGQKHPDTGRYVDGWRWVNGGRGRGHAKFPARVLRVGE